MASVKVSVLGVPVGLGTGKCPPDCSPQWEIRTDLLREALERIGCEVEDCGCLDVPRPGDPGNPLAKYLREICLTCGQVAEWVIGRHRAGRIPLVVGGDHSIAAGSVAGSAAYHRARGERIGLLWMDAHADMNTPETTPSGNVHGMSLAALLGLGPSELRDVLGYSPKVDAANTVLIGVRDVDGEECTNIEKAGLEIVTMREVDERGMYAVMQEALQDAGRGTAGVHLSLDMDALDPSVAPGVGTPVPGGLTFREAHLALEMLADSGKLLSLDVVEGNPILDPTGLTAKVSIGLIGSALGKSILPPRLCRRPRGL